jgi:hypothetical protein
MPINRNISGLRLAFALHLSQLKDDEKLEEEILMSPKIAFPKKELNKWLKAHKTWDHDDWLQLLDDLKTKGYSDLVNNQEGQDSVGLYLETNRKN